MRPLAGSGAQVLTELRNRGVGDVLIVCWEPGPHRRRTPALDNRWKKALNAFDICFDGRLSAARR